MNANGFPYTGEDNDDYVNGQFCPREIVGCTREFASKFAFLSLARQFCCNDGTPEAAQARAMARTRAAIDGNLTTLNLGGTRQTASSLALPSLAQGFKPNDEYEKMQFYYHPDHLGSSSYITNLDGEVSQHIEYVPFGEVFIEERNNTWNTPYLFNAKEFDEETGMYYYGARYYEPRLSLWMSTDPLEEENEEFCSYIFSYNNPITYKDPDGTIPIETVWDAANVALGVGSLVSNIRQGNVGAAVIDGVGVIFDAAATVLPYIPGGVGTTIKSYRASKGLVKVGEAAAKAEKITKPVSSSKVSKAVNTSKATSKPKVTRRAAFRQAKRDAGIPTSQTHKTHKRGDAAKNKNSGRRGIEYEYDAQGSYGTQQTKYVQDHYEGHTYLDGSVIIHRISTYINVLNPRKMIIITIHTLQRKKMINELSSYFLNKESSLSVPMQVSELVNASYKISVIDYDYVGFAKEVDYTSFAKKLFDYCKNINIHNFTFVSISREMDNNRMVKKGYKPDFNPKGLDCKMSIHHANINDGKIIFITVVSTESENVFEQIVKTMYTGTFDSGYILLPSHIPIDQNGVVDNIKKSIQIIYDRHGYVKNIYISLKDMHETSELEYISYPYGGGDFGSFLLFTLCRGNASNRELPK